MAGYDPEARQVLIADRDGELHALSMRDLALARGSKFKPFPPQHLWYTVDFTARRAPAREEIRQAIREACAGMPEPPISNLGVRGICKAAESTLEWPDVMGEDELRYACLNAFIFIDATGGTGGGILRYMYGRFLKEAAGRQARCRRSLTRNRRPGRSCEISQPSRAEAIARSSVRV